MSENILSGVKQTYAPSDFFNYSRELPDFGDSVEFRVIKLNTEYVKLYEARKANAKFTKKDGTFTIGSKWVLYPGDAVAGKAKDAKGELLSTKNPAESCRMIVWVISKTVKDDSGNGKKVVEINKPMYLELSQHMIGLFNGLNSSDNGNIPFSTTKVDGVNVNRPEYTVSLQVLKTTNPSFPKSFVFVPKPTDMIDHEPVKRADFRVAFEKAFPAFAEAVADGSVDALRNKVLVPATLESLIKELGLAPRDTDGATGTLAVDPSANTGDFSEDLSNLLD